MRVDLLSGLNMSYVTTSKDVCLGKSKITVKCRPEFCSMVLSTSNSELFDIFKNLFDSFF